MAKTIVTITATVRILSTVKGKTLVNASQFVHDEEVSNAFLRDDAVMKAVCDTAVRFAYVDSFRIRLKNDPELKNAIGGTRWSVDVLDLTYEVKEPIVAN